MTLNRDVFVRDPSTHPIPNDGVAKVGRPRTPEEWRILEWELKNFVCTGEYERGLERVLSTYLANLDRNIQPAAWVSGFYGSGKSHFALILEHLWIDQELPSGVTPRALVQVPEGIAAALTELTTAGAREGGLWSAAGKLSSGAGESIRLAFLGILFSAAGLPVEYPTAKFVLRLRSESAYDVFCQALETRGKSVESELHHIYVSPAIGEALLEAIPGFAPSEEEARMLLREQYPHVPNISQDDLLSTMEEILALQSTKRTDLPCTLIVLDELQQFLDDNPTQTQPVIDLVEACSARFGASLLFLGTGQSALGASPLLGKLQDRFTVRVHLTDTDIERVVRSVVLQKLPDREAELRTALEAVSGEIDRHLPGTTIAPSGADANDLVPDYPILPTRRRFWELVLKAVDEGGGGLLRSQLRTTHAAAVRVANQPLGQVIGGDFIFEDQEAEMLQSAILLREVDEDIRRLDDGTEDGSLLARLCATIFLISRLPRESGADAGVRATSDTLAYLVVTDLPVGSGDLRRRVPELLDGLVEQGKIQKVEDEYRLQTREGQEWEADFRRREKAIGSDAAQVASIRGDLLRSAVERAVGSLKVLQGASKEARSLALHSGEAPPTVEDKIPVWVRDGWAVAEGAVRADAAAAGMENAVVHVYLPKRSTDDLIRAIATLTAASDVLSTRTAVTDEAREAKLAMQHRCDAADRRVNTVVDDVIGNALVLKGGGTIVSGASLKESLSKAGEDAAVRLYPRFADADHTGWGTVLRRAGDGNAGALEAVSYTGDPKSHPVCKAVLEFVGAGKRGSEVRSRFAGAEYGWSKDAVDGSLLTLLAAGLLEATTDGVPTTAKQLTVPKIGVTTFRAQSGRVPGVDERAAFRAVCQVAGVGCRSGEEADKSGELLRALIDLARSTGGAAPLPEPASTIHLEEQQANPGNERVIEIAGMSDLKNDVDRWRTLADTAQTRMASWQLVGRLVAHAADLPEAAVIHPQLAAIEDQRTLLSDPDPLMPIRQGLTSILRDALTAARDQVSTERSSARNHLQTAEGWPSVDESQRDRILRGNDLLEPPALTVGSDDELLQSLDRLSLPGWGDKFRAVHAALEAALLELARIREPDARPIRLPHATLKRVEDVEPYVADVRKKLETEVANGPIVVS